MGVKSKIEWTDATWNPTSGCSKVSAGCAHCYALRTWARLSAPGQPYAGRKFTDVQCHPDRLDQPLRWKKPRIIFVNSMSDLFHPAVPDGFIDQVFAVMALSAQHTFQVLTKRPERMREYLQYMELVSQRVFKVGIDLVYEGSIRGPHDHKPPWPLPNVWLGVSVEDQAALHRLDDLRGIPNAMPWVSLEPLLEEVDITPWLDFLRWVVVGGESGPGARPFDIQWARGVIAQCRAAGVPAYVKQLGRHPVHECQRCGPGAGRGMCRMFGDAEGHGHDGMLPIYLHDRKGGDIAEWPEDLRVREMPGVG